MSNALKTGRWTYHVYQIIERDDLTMTVKLKGNESTFNMAPQGILAVYDLRYNLLYLATAPKRGSWWVKGVALSDDEIHGLSQRDIIVKALEQVESLDECQKIDHREVITDRDGNVMFHENGNPKTRPVGLNSAVIYHYHGMEDERNRDRLNAARDNLIAVENQVWEEIRAWKNEIYHQLDLGDVEIG